MRVHGDLHSGSRAPHENIPTNEDLLSAADLAGCLAALGEPQPSVAFVGDTMLGGRTRKVIAAHGSDYPFASVRPLMQRAHALIGNLEGPFACRSAKQKRNHSYRVNPRLAGALPRAGFRVMTLANNHLLDCGREGVVETLEALEHVGVIAIGAGRDLPAAHSPAM
jgi:poly-gamma-glutamate capsule biosynthesis protein CapA/YwtB (metallophosphatase superfamily)